MSSPLTFSLQNGSNALLEPVDGAHQMHALLVDVDKLHLDVLVLTPLLR